MRDAGGLLRGDRLR
nr:hypothetical protein [Mesorhizobium sp. M2D.F.Ca.ET.223.01.1.1]